MRNSLVIYTGSFRFPIGDAGAARVLGIGKALRTAGFEVVFGGGEAEGRPEDRNEFGGYRYQGFAYVPQGHLFRDDSGPWRRVLQMGRAGKETLRWIERHRPHGIAAIIAYDPSTPLLLRLKRYAGRHRIRLVVDLTEWPTGRNLPGGLLGARNLDSEFRLRYLYRQSDNVIGVSSFLAEYYRRASCRTVRIPPLVDLDDPKWNAPSGENAASLQLIYAGTPGNKDLLGNILRGLLFPEGRAVKAELHLVGVTQEQAARLCGGSLQQSGDGNARVICYDRISQNEVPRRLAAADFSVLLRPDEKYAHAGFPTKLAESLSAGTPAIVNATSDIAEYVRDGREGFIVPGHSPEAFAATLRKIAAIPRERIRDMKHLAKQRACEVFDYRSYRSVLQEFLAG